MEGDTPNMERLAVWIIGLAFLVSAAAFAGDQAVPGSSESEHIKGTSLKTVKMKTTGRVVEVTDTLLKIERSVKGTVETFEFTLEKPITKFKIGDKVVVRYITRGDKNVLREITLQRRAKPLKKILQPGEKEEPDIPPAKGSGVAK
jgi:hypothetical protein